MATMRQMAQFEMGVVFAALLCVQALHAEEQPSYRVIPLPVPSHVILEVTGLTAIGDGKVAAATRRGEVWIVHNAYDNPPRALRFSRFAYGLHEPLGLVQVDNAFFVTQRTELTRIRDRDQDGEADEYITVAKGWGVTGNYHEYAYGPRLDRAGNFWLTLNIGMDKNALGPHTWRGWGIRVSPRGRITPVCAGMRSPCGLGANADGDMFYTDQQGRWFGTNGLFHLQQGAFYGHPESLRAEDLLNSDVVAPKKLPEGKTVAEVARLVPSYRLPAVWFPYEKVGRSVTDIACDQTGGRYGPFSSQLFVGGFVHSEVFRVALEKVRGEYQGACFRFLSGFQAGIVRLAWGEDGSLFAGETNRGWNSRGTRSYGLERVVWTGRELFAVRTVRARSDGFLIEFTSALDVESAARKTNYSLKSYTYTYHSRYGSPEVDTRQLAVTRARVSQDRMRARIEVDGLREGYVHELDLRALRSAQGHELDHGCAYYTLNRIPSP